MTQISRCPSGALDRRTFLACATGLTASAALALPPAVGTLPLAGLVVDDALSLGARIANVPIRYSGADVTRLWADWLSPLWRESPVAVAGILQPEALFVVERFAWDRGMRAGLHAEYDSAGRILRARGPTGVLRKLELASDWSDAVRCLANFSLNDRARRSIDGKGSARLTAFVLLPRRVSSGTVLPSV